MCICKSCECELASGFRQYLVDLDCGFGFTQVRLSCVRVACVLAAMMGSHGVQYVGKPIGVCATLNGILESD